MRKWAELVKKGFISEDKYKKRLTETKNPHKLPERITPKKDSP